MDGLVGSRQQRNGLRCGMGPPFVSPKHRASQLPARAYAFSTSDDVSGRQRADNFAPGGRTSCGLLCTLIRTESCGVRASRMD